ncbi:endonuclease/exonuclease/phosphatase family protein [Vibrio sp. TH_r3]|uniref:endonuclease/exonuclease/phosphatase family protein n=1 Tax=Vibrio sp. TH_r3 TaxID=3082084 RepID=UPI0029556C79|nr:endonuclease/exonuclease/phosphatase family protein [Vibrio sp. TH_r3]MDV7103536.1 endonuclease/exonuclease/phosphatase family protein [Vibrio sp. TH_r3]
MTKFNYVRLFLLLWLFHPQTLNAALELSTKPLVVTSWNLQWLTTDKNTVAPLTNRNSRDTQVLAQYFNKVSPDVLAFQEVDSIQAIKNIVGNRYVIYLSDRTSPTFKSRQFDDINQYTGFAIKQTINVIDPADLVMTQNTSKLRFASYVIVQGSNEASDIHLLSVHLKAGCPAQYKRTRDCNLLKQQALLVNKWLKQRVEAKQRFVVAGDFNHNLAYPNDWLYVDISTDIKQHVNLASKTSQPNCIVRSNRNNKATYQFRSLIDHILLSKHLTHGAVKQQIFSPDDVLTYRLSDHCPLSTIIFP